MGLVILGVLILYIIFSVCIVIAAQKIGRTKNWKLCNSWSAAAIMILIPTWDVPIGWLYFHNVCNTQSGYFIYRQVHLDSSYLVLNSLSEHNFEPINGEGKHRFDWEKVRKDYIVPVVPQVEVYSKIFWLERFSTKIETRLGEVLGEAVSFVFSYGWLNNLLEQHATEACPMSGIERYKFHSNFKKAIFDLSERSE